MGRDKSSNCNKIRRGDDLKMKIRSFGIGQMSESEVLEYLLTLDRPSKDSSELAKQLLNRFCCLGEILDADEIELREINGIGENKALALSTLTSVYWVYQKAKTEKVTLENNDELYNFVVERMIPFSSDTTSLFCFDERFRYINRIDIFESNTRNVTFSISQFAKEAVSVGAEYVAIGCKFSNGTISTIDEVFNFTLDAVTQLEVLDIHVLDSIIVKNGVGLSVIEKAKELVENGVPVTETEKVLAHMEYPKIEKSSIENKNNYDDEYFEYENKYYSVSDYKKRRK